jgi:ribose-phosphate pyrophosphokinase
MWKKALSFAICSGAVWASYIPPTNTSPLKLFSASYSRDLAFEVAGILGVQLGRVQLSKFSDGEINVKICEDVSDKVVFLIASLGHPVNDSIVELLLFLSALKRANCRKVVLIVPYLAYNRQDRPAPGNFYCPAEDITKLIETMEVDSIIGIDFHDQLVSGHFSIPVHELRPFSLAINYLQSKKLRHPVIVSPDIRGTSRAHEFYKLLSASGIHCDLAVLPNPGASMSYLSTDSYYLGGSLSGRDVIIVDDMMITGSTIFKCLENVRNQDAERVFAFATHPVLPGSSIRNLEKSSLDELICTNTLKLAENSEKIVQLSVAGLIAKQVLEVFERPERL